MNAMVHASGDELNNKFADFSAGWLKDSFDDAPSYKANQIKNRKRLKSVKNAAPIANRNISSIVSRIRDEGSAFSSSDAKNDKPAKPDSPSENIEKTKYEAALFETNKTFADACDDDRLSLSSGLNKSAHTPSAEQHKDFREPSKPSFSAVCDNQVEIDTDENVPVAAVRKKSRIKQFSLIVIMGFMVIAIFAYMSYQFKLQSDEMKQTLLMYKQTMNEGKLSQGKVLSVTTVTVKNKVLPTLKQADPAVFFEQQSISAANIKAIKLANNEANNESSVTVVKAAEIKIKSPVTAVVESEKIDAAIKIPAKEKLTVKPVTIKKSSVKTYVAVVKPLMFTVNLASFSERKKAYDQLSIFKTFGVSPVVEQTVVANKTIYRLCVEGFSSREEASGFISHLNKKYAINAWVRQS